MLRKKCKRRYNKKFYRLFAGTTKFIRKSCSPDPTGEIKKSGITGNALGCLINKKIESPIIAASFKLTSLTYDKRKDKPYKGSATYSAWYIAIKTVLKFVLGAIFGISIVSFILAVIDNILLAMARITLAIIPIVTVIYIVKFIKNHF